MFSICDSFLPGLIHDNFPNKNLPVKQLICQKGKSARSAGHFPSIARSQDHLALRLLLLHDLFINKFPIHRER